MKRRTRGETAGEGGNSTIWKEKGKETYRSRGTRVFASSRGPQVFARESVQTNVARVSARLQCRANLISFTLRER